MNEAEEVKHNNMVSNLPLLFANGYPTSLEKITQVQLENFIPFMVQCSLGNINIQGKVDLSEPEWWPEDVPFTIPLSKPRKFSGSWLKKMKEIVNICYNFHEGDFLLQFCSDLSSYEQASLRFINNYNSTTSLFDRRINKLLVTFRNENMSYDQPYRNRKCLLQQKSKTQTEINHPHMVESAPFDIYLCDNCDAELYSYEAILDHEKACCLSDEIIICDSSEPEEEDDINVSGNSTEQTELRKAFLLNFGLQSNEICSTSNMPTSVESTKDNADCIHEEVPKGKVKRKRLPKRNRGFYPVKMSPYFPWSSPAGQVILKKSNAVITQDYLSERFERIERLCRALPLSLEINRPKYLDKKMSFVNVPRTFKMPQEFSMHRYTFPKKTFRSKKRNEDFALFSSLLTKRCCRPFSIRLKRMTENDVKRKKLECSTLNIKLKRDNIEGSNWKIASPTTNKSEDVIDLCSSDEGEDFSVNNEIPRNILELFQSEIAGKEPNKITNLKTEKSISPNKSAEKRKNETLSPPSCSKPLLSPKNFSGNFTVSQKPIVNCSSLKPPLHPTSQASFYLFQNCSTTSHNNEQFSTELCNVNEDHRENSQNQENLNKSNNNFNGNSWFLNNLNSRNNNNHSNNRRASHSNGRGVKPLLQFSSPKPISSID